MRILVLCLFLLTAYSNAFYAFGNIGDSRLQSENNVYKPGGIINWSLGVGFFDEPQNVVACKLFLGFSRMSYSYGNAKESVSLYMMDFNLISWSATYKNVYFEVYGGFSFLLMGTNFTSYMHEKVLDSFIDQERVYPKYGYRLGFYVVDKLMVSLTAHYNYVWWRYGDGSWDGSGQETLLVGGFGLSIQYNLF